VMERKEGGYVVGNDGPQRPEGFAEAIVGMSAEESKTVTLKLPEEHRNKELAGQDAEFEITVHWVKAKILPELDDMLPSVVGTEHETLDSLRGAIRENLSVREEHERRMAHEEKVVDSVVEQSTVDLPPQLVEEEAGRLVQQLAQNLERQGIPLQSYLRFTQKTEEQFRSEMMAQAERSVRRSEVLNAIALAEGIDVTDDEIQEQLKAGLEDTNENRRLIRDSMRRPEVKNRFAASMRRERAIRMLLETVGGVDFAALEAAEAAGASDVLADPIDEAVDEAEMEAEIESVSDTATAAVDDVIESAAEAVGITEDEAALALLSVTAAEAAAGVTPTVVEAVAEAETPSETAEKPRPVPGETTA